MSGQNPIMASMGRIAAMVQRHIYVLKSSWPRLLETIYWPTINVVMWGFTSQFFGANASSLMMHAAGLLIGAAILWDVLYRANLGVSISFLEEMWSRNLGHLSVSPLRPWEMAASWFVMAIIRTFIGVLPATALAYFLYKYSIYDLGLPLIALWANLLISGAIIGLVVAALVLRFGMGAESLAWVLVFAIAPFSAIYYPLSTLPDFMQMMALFLPTSHVFEGMRMLVIHGSFAPIYLWVAMMLNAFWGLVAFAVFLRAHHVARTKGLLLNQGE